MTTHHQTPARRLAALLAAALAVLVLTTVASPVAAGAAVAPTADPPGGRQWIDRPTEVELAEGRAQATLSLLHCREPGHGDRVVLQRVHDGQWADVLVHVLGPSMCETVVWQLGTVHRGHGGSWRLVTRQGQTVVDAVPFRMLVRLEPPTISAHPRGGTVGLGGRLTLRSSAAGVGGAPRTQWESSRDGQTWAPVAGATSTVLETPAATAGMDGTRYRAVHTRAGMTSFETGGVAVSDVATLTVREAPTITTQPSSASVPAGETVVFEAAADGAPTPTVQWEAAPPGAAWAEVPGATAELLEVRDVTAAMDGTRYRAVFRNTQGTRTTDEVRLAVLLPPQVSRHPEDVVALPGEPVEFRSSVTGPPPWHIGWQVLPPGADPDDGWTGLPGPSGFVHAVVATPELDGARFRAVFGNEIGETVTEPALLTVVVVAPVRLAVEPRVQPVVRLAGW